MIGFTGEANTKNPAPYKCLFHAMIEDWRLKWNEGTDGSTDPQFPFGFMQVGLLNFLHICSAVRRCIRLYCHQSSVHTVCDWCIVEIAAAGVVVI